MFTVSTPRFGARFWAALCLASICGINIGDLLPDTFHVPPLFALAVLVAAFAALALAQALIKQRAEVLFWSAVLADRAAATVLADFAVHNAHLGFPAAIAALAFLLLACIAVTGGFARPATSLAAGPMFWLMLLLAAALGTAAADWSGLSFGSPKIGFPATAAIETVLIAVALLLKRATGGRAWSFWLAVLVICAWGSSAGDIAGFLLSVPVSLGGSAILLGLIILAWPSARAAVDVRM